MKPKMMLKILIDIAMTVSLLFLMAYEMVGQTAHEWIGIGMAVLFFLHHILNRKWWGNIGKGKYTPFRIAQTVLVFFVLLTMIGSMVSGVILSRHVLAFLPVQGGRSLGRDLHMLSAYWGFILMSLLKDRTDKETVLGKEKAAVRHLKVCGCCNRKDGTAGRRSKTVPDR